MMLADTIGFLAASMTTCAFVPQVVQSYRTRDVSGISLVTYLNGQTISVDGGAGVA